MRKDREGVRLQTHVSESAAEIVFAKGKCLYSLSLSALKIDPHQSRVRTIPRFKKLHVDIRFVWTVERKDYSCALCPFGGGRVGVDQGEGKWSQLVSYVRFPLSLQVLILFFFFSSSFLFLLRFSRCAWSWSWLYLPNERTNEQSHSTPDRSNLNLRSGISPISRMLDLGIPVSLGTDVSGGYGAGILSSLWVRPRWFGRWLFDNLRIGLGWWWLLRGVFIDDFLFWECDDADWYVDDKRL